MRAVSLLLLGMLASCGGSQGGRTQGDDVALNPEVLQPKPTATTLAGVDFNKPVRAFGTEPFWALDIAPGVLRFEDFSLREGEKAEWVPQVPKIADNAALIETETRAGEPVTIILIGENCLEVGEEEDSLPLKAMVRIGERTLTGCAGEKLPPPGSPEAENVVH